MSRTNKELQLGQWQCYRHCNLVARSRKYEIFHYEDTQHLMVSSGGWTLPVDTPKTRSMAGIQHMIEEFEDHKTVLHSSSYREYIMKAFLAADPKTRSANHAIAEGGSLFDGNHYMGWISHKQKVHLMRFHGILFE